MPIIPPPPEGEVVLIAAAEGFKGPFFEDNGPIDLECGRCTNCLATGLHPEQIQNIVLRCPVCGAYNAVISIPTLQGFVQGLQSFPVGTPLISQLRNQLSDALDRRVSPSELIAEVGDQLPEFNWIRDLVIPTNAGELYAFLAFLLAFLTWYQSQKKRGTETAATVINNFFVHQDPFAGVHRNDLCPCGSGLKYKFCHGRA